MKKLVTLFLAAGMLLTSVAGASAVEFRPSGELRFGFFASNNLLSSGPHFQDNASWNANFDDDSFEPVRTRYRMYYTLNLDFIANEQLSGRIGIKSSERNFASTGGQNNWESAFYVNTAYIDWYIPNTPVQVRMGRWTQGTMNFTGTLQLLSPVVAQDGVRVSAKINDNVTLTGIWWRRGDARRDGVAETNYGWVSAYNYNFADQFYLEAPLTFDGIRANVWGTYIRNQGHASYGPNGVPAGGFSVPLTTAWFATWDADAEEYLLPIPSWTDSRVFAFGAGISVSKFSPFVFAADFGYSNLEVSNVEFLSGDGIIPGFEGTNAPNAFDRKGWYLSGRVSYNTAFGTPSLFAWYTSGDDDNLSNGSERPLNAGTGPSGIYSLFGSDWNSKLKLGEDGDFSMVGSWGVSAQWSNISFVDKLTHHVALSYIRGTNDPYMARFQGINASYDEVEDEIVVSVDAVPSPYAYMTTKDSAIALELSNSYQVYKELTMAFDMFYIWQNFDAKTWSTVVDPDLVNFDQGPENTALRLGDREPKFSNAWGIGLSFTYAF